MSETLLLLHAHTFHDPLTGEYENPLQSILQAVKTRRGRGGTERGAQGTNENDKNGN